MGKVGRVIVGHLAVLALLPFAAGLLLLPDEITVEAESEWAASPEAAAKWFVESGECWSRVAAAGERQNAADGGADWIVGDCRNYRHRMRQSGTPSIFEFEWSDDDLISLHSRLVLQSSPPGTRATMSEHWRYPGAWRRAMGYAVGFIWERLEPSANPRRRPNRVYDRDALAADIDRLLAEMGASIGRGK